MMFVLWSNSTLNMCLDVPWRKLDYIAKKQLFRDSNVNTCFAKNRFFERAPDFYATCDMSSLLLKCDLSMCSLREIFENGTI